MKKTFYLDFGRRPQEICIFSSSINSLFGIKTETMTKISFLPLLFMEIALKKTFSLHLLLQNWLKFTNEMQSQPDWVYHTNIANYRRIKGYDPDYIAV